MKSNMILLLLPLLLLPNSAMAGKTESAFERVERTGVIRCGYFIYEPYISKDPATGKLSGFSYDLMNAVGKKLGVKIEWTEEVGFETMLEGIKTNRYDAVCGDAWQNARRAHHVFFSIPYSYTPIFIWVAGNTRKTFDNLNDPSVTIGTLDGEMSDIVAQSSYPNAKKFSIPQLSPFSDLLMNVTSHKADITFAEERQVSDFEKTHPGALRKLSKTPLNIMGNTFLLPQDPAFKNLIDSALTDIIYSPEYDAIAEAYGGADKIMMKRPALPYRD